MKTNILILFIAFASGSSLLAQAPTIYYEPSYVLEVGQMIPPIVPMNSGGEVPAIPYGTTTTYAGSTSGFLDALSTNAKFDSPQGLGIDFAGNVYVADRGNQRIRKITSNGNVSTVAGNGSRGLINDIGDKAAFAGPADVVADSHGNLYVSELYNHTIRKIAYDGRVTTLAGAGIAGYMNGTGETVKFNTPMGLTIDKNEIIYVGDRYNHRIRRMTTLGEVSIYAGSGIATGINGTGENATFNNCTGVAVDNNGMLYVGDYGNNLIRKISTTRTVSTLAGCYCGALYDGNGYSAAFKNPYGIAVGTAGDIFVADFSSHCIRRVTPLGEVTTLAGTGVAGKANGVGKQASFNMPSDVTVDADGNIYVADYGNHQIRKIISTGYIISPELPTGLTFNSATGEITGTPVQIMDNTEYTVIAYNKNGSSKRVFTLSISESAGVDEIESQKPFILYPNPLSQGDKLIVLLSYVNNEYCEVIIHDRLGRTLFQRKCLVRGHRMEIDFDYTSQDMLFVELVGIGTQSLYLGKK